MCIRDSSLFVLSAFTNSSSDAIWEKNPANKLYPRTLVEVLLSEALEQDRILHSPDLGGFITFQSRGKRGLASIDDRNVLHGEAPYRKYLSLLNAKESGVDLSSFDWILLQKQNSLNILLAADESWRFVGDEVTDLDLFILYRRVTGAN